AEAAIALRNDHGEELVALEAVPRLRRQVAQLPLDLPFVEHAAELVDRAVEERLLLLGQGRWRERQQLRPIGIAAEQVGVPTDVKVPSVTAICSSPMPRRTQLSTFTVIEVVPILMISA